MVTIDFSPEVSVFTRLCAALFSDWTMSPLPHPVVHSVFLLLISFGHFKMGPLLVNVSLSSALFHHHLVLVSTLEGTANRGVSSICNNTPEVIVTRRQTSLPQFASP